MKRIIALMLTLVMSMGLAACGDVKDTDTDIETGTDIDTGADTVIESDAQPSLTIGGADISEFKII